MKNLISFQLAFRLSLILFGLFTVFHFVIIIGILLFDFVPVDYLWGGRMETKEELLVFEIISLLIMGVCLFVVLIKAKRINLPRLMGTANVMLWILFAVFTLNTIGNFLAQTTFEKFFAIVTIISAILMLRLALEKNSR